MPSTELHIELFALANLGSQNLSHQETPQTLTIEIQDSGTGFTAESMTRAFERFYRSPDRG